MARSNVIDINRIPEYRRALMASVAGALRNVGDETLDAIDEGFEQGTTAMGEPWAPLAPATIEQTGPEILIDTGEMRDSFTSTVEWSPMGDKKLIVSSDDEKLKYHEFGTETMPRRPVMEPAARYIQREALPDELEDAAKNAEDVANVRGVGISSI